MSSTRYSQQPLQIYQDPVTSFDHAPIPSAQNSNPKKSSPLRPIKNAASRRNIVFNPPQAGASKQSPSKSSSSPPRPPFSTKLNMISMPPPGGPSYNTDSMEKKQPTMSKFKPQKALFTTFTSSANDKENYSQPYYNQTPIAPYSDGLSRASFSLEGLYPQKPPAKRLMEAAPIHESRPFKRTKIEDGQEGEQVVNLEQVPPPESFPPLHDDGTKPPHSYAQLIGMSILRAPSRRLTLAQIYKWISDTYRFYSASDAGWQNSIRHNLSLNKAFIKQERPKDDPGKGNYWAIQPGMEHQFIKDKTVRKPTTGPNENVPMLSTNLAPITHSEPTQFKPLVPAPPPTQELPPPPPQQPYSLPELQLPSIPELSSDATIPASDIINEPDPDEEAPTILAPSSPLIQSSPPTAMMNSSPPIPRYVPRRQNTPPPVPRFPSPSRSRSHKRKFASMDDSGYISSLDSSAIRSHRLLTSEADRPRIKRGRAEEEIARLRGSSYDSPTKGPRTLFIPPSSSPLRIGRGSKSENSQMLPPFTPAIKLKPPTRPPPSVSPNTNLRLHRDKVREMVGSPLRDMHCLDEGIPFSPAFHLDDTSYMFQDFIPGGDFDIFSDTNLPSIPGNGSPEKKSAKRPRLDRSRSANILADISNTNFNKNVTSTPLLKFTPSTNMSASAFNSPLKGLGLLDSPGGFLGIDSPTKIQITSPSFSLTAFDLPQEDTFYGAEFLTDDIGDSSGWDIMQGFQKIGSGTTGGNGAQSTRSTPKTGSSRPAFGRSLTSQF
jgi:forkhead transcription factor HCM1